MAASRVSSILCVPANKDSMRACQLYAVSSRQQRHRLIPALSSAASLDVQGRNGMTHAGLVSAIYCSVGAVAAEVQALMEELQLERDHNAVALNSIVFRVLVQLNALLDSTAATMQLHAPCGVRGNVYFTDYLFADPVLEHCRQSILQLPRYRGMTVRQLGNAAKHYGPWFGVASSKNIARRGDPEVRVWDLVCTETDTALVHDVIIPLYTQLRVMITHIAEPLSDVARVALPRFDR
jgi:hypothetical protein